MAAVIAGRSGWKYPILAAAASQIGGKAVAYLSTGRDGMGVRAR